VSRTIEPRPVKLIVGVILNDPGLLEALEADLAGQFGAIDLRSPVFDFGVTDYYQNEMGPDLKRVFYTFEELIDPAAIVEVKLAANRIESQTAVGGNRRVNIDPGYMDFYKLVLVSNKFQGQKVYLGKGVYADPTLYYDKGWKPYDWGFPDFRSGRYYGFLSEMRKAYKAAMKGRI
jgi:hypothetical protein